MGSNSLTGSVAALGSLNNLTILYLYENDLTGSIPASFGEMNGLDLLLNLNQFTGCVPEGTDLRDVNPQGGGTRIILLA